MPHINPAKEPAHAIAASPTVGRALSLRAFLSTEPSAEVPISDGLSPLGEVGSGAT
jgi:hypothetical protein